MEEMKKNVISTNLVKISLNISLTLPNLGFKVHTQVGCGGGGWPICSFFISQAIDPEFATDIPLGRLNISSGKI